MRYLENILFAIVLLVSFGFFFNNIKKIIRNIRLGVDVKNENTRIKRITNVIKFAFGQAKMKRKPIVAIFHGFIYVGFILINLELVEIFIDGLFGTHRFFSFVGSFYHIVISSFEIMALLVIVAVSVFYIRRNVLKINRFKHSDLNGWAKKDANYILIFELIIMLLFLFMNSADLDFDNSNIFLVSQYIKPIFEGQSSVIVAVLYKMFWWLHILGILLFMNYLYYSKHLHIFFAFPNIYYSNSDNVGQLNNLQSITKEIKPMLGITLDEDIEIKTGNEVNVFGAKDVQDLSRIQLLNAYSCTECGRCTSACPANITGKKLSPRKIMMDVRDRIEEVGDNIDFNKGAFIADNKSLLYDYISTEEVWACTFCTACVEECPVNINPMSVILDLRRYLIMEKGEMPQTINVMMTNIENNGVPWQYNQQDRLNWKD